MHYSPLAPSVHLLNCTGNTAARSSRRDIEAVTAREASAANPRRKSEETQAAIQTVLRSDRGESGEWGSEKPPAAFVFSPLFSFHLWAATASIAETQGYSPAFPVRTIWTDGVTVQARTHPRRLSAPPGPQATENEFSLAPGPALPRKEPRKNARLHQGRLCRVGNRERMLACTRVSSAA